MTTNNAEARYNELTDEANLLMGRLADLMSAHAKDGRITYGHVGDMAQVVEYLGDAVNFMTSDMAQVAR